MIHQNDWGVQQGPKKEEEEEEEEVEKASLENLFLEKYRLVVIGWEKAQETIPQPEYC